MPYPTTCFMNAAVGSGRLWVEGLVWSIIVAWVVALVFGTVYTWFAARRALKEHHQ